MWQDLEEYRKTFAGYQGSRYMDYPYLVSIETMALCNAACDFCPYPGIERKGKVMSDELIMKILNECRSMPSDLPFVMILSRVNEPFLDKRIFDISYWINRELPSASFNFFSNASPLTESSLLKLGQVKNINVLVLSVNEYRPEVYERVMAIPFDRTMQRVADLHRMKKEGKLYFSVAISRVGDGSEHDQEFRRWAEANFPLFECVVTARCDWIGAVKTFVSPVPDVGCTQWFTLDILADGKAAFCCVDSEGARGVGDAARQHILEIYNERSRRLLRENATSRLQVPGCRLCPLLA